MATGALAESARPAQPAPAAPAPAAPAHVPAAPALAPAAAAPAAPALSESKFLGVLYAEIARRTPQETTAGPGEVRASFIVGPKGRIDKVTIDKTTSPAHAEVVKKILGEVQVPPPPGGSMDVGQTFKFY